MREKYPELTALGAKVRALRLERKLSQEAFADAVDLDRAYMGRIERGENNPTVLTLYRIARTLKVPITSLFKG
jgi:transcriptional regulator with XRE-family HTH domain